LWIAGWKNKNQSTKTNKQTANKKSERARKEIIKMERVK